jgi:hypothetical protein
VKGCPNCKNRVPYRRAVMCGQCWKRVPEDMKEPLRRIYSRNVKESPDFVIAQREALAARGHTGPTIAEAVLAVAS